MSTSPAESATDPNTGTPAAPEGQQQPTGQPTQPIAAPAASAASASHPWDDPTTAQAEIERLRRENAKDRTAAKTAAADEARNALAQSIGKALGLVKDDAPVDPAVLTQQLEQSQAMTLQARIENAAMRAALAGGADPVKLLDSVAFLQKVGALDPADSAGYAAAVAETLKANPSYAVNPGPRAPRPDWTQGSGGNGKTATSPAEDFAAYLKQHLGQ